MPNDGRQSIEHTINGMDDKASKEPSDAAAQASSSSEDDYESCHSHPLDPPPTNLHFVYRLWQNSGCIDVLFAAPRLCSLCLGVFIPMFALILISVVCGLFLAWSEAPYEIASNDAYLRQQAQALIISQFRTNLTEWVPRFCFHLYFTNTTAREIERRVELALWNLTADQPVDVEQIEGWHAHGDLVIVNTTAIYDFVTDCMVRSNQIVAASVQNATYTGLVNTSGTYTFNWIRCAPGANESGLLRVPIDELRPQAQENYYQSVWNASQQTLYEQYLSEAEQAGVPDAIARAEAREQSITDASGGAGCEFNGAGSAWFWFTILTTVGYGNQSPSTRFGKALVYTLGFLSIIAFAGILSTAGYIVSAVFDDFVRRTKVPLLHRPWGACSLWGVFYYGWMAVIAVITAWWKRNQLGEADFQFSDGYWFSYISITTVGLGDIFLEPQVILFRDLFIFPLSFLFGFVFVAAFLGKFAESLTGCSGRLTLVEALVGRFSDSGLVGEIPRLVVAMAKMLVRAVTRCCPKQSGCGRKARQFAVVSSPEQDVRHATSDPIVP